MSTPNQTELSFFYWNSPYNIPNPWESYRSYVKDATLAKYTTEAIGQYINQASKEQIQTINALGHKVAYGMNALYGQLTNINQSMSIVSQQIVKTNQNIKEGLSFINKNLDIQIEQQRMSNLLLQNIIQLLRVPDSEKERQHSIELGIKFFVNAQKDADLYSDALDEFLKAETLMKQDYFVLHRIGCIYLYVDKHLNPERALDYFLRAAKYASIESDSNAIRYFNALTQNKDQNAIKELKKDLDKYESSFNFNKVPALRKSEFKGWYIEKLTYKLYTVYNKIDDGYKCEENDKIFFSDLLSSDTVNEALKKDLKAIKGDIDKILEKHRFINNNLNSINFLASDSYEKAAFAAYVLGQFNNSVTYQAKAFKFNPTAQNQFILSKYQVRNGNLDDAINNLRRAINSIPELILGVFRDLDLLGEPRVLDLIKDMNDSLDRDINEFILKWRELSLKSSNNIKPDDVNAHLMNNVEEILVQLKNERYDIKRAQYINYLFEYDRISKELESENKEIDNLRGLIDDLVNEINNSPRNRQLESVREELMAAKQFEKEKMRVILKKHTTLKDYIISTLKSIDSLIIEIENSNFCSFSEKIIDGIKQELENSKNLPFETMRDALNRISNEVDRDKLKIGSKFAGGIVFYLDKTGKHGLVCTDKDIGSAIWGGIGYISADGKGIGTGRENTTKIVRCASFRSTGFWGNKKEPLLTAARICTEFNNGFSDWYLPSIDELELMIKVLNQIHNINLKDGIYYWSSTETELELPFVDRVGNSSYLCSSKGRVIYYNYHDMRKLSDNSKEYFLRETGKICPDFTKHGVHAVRGIRNF